MQHPKRETAPGMLETVSCVARSLQYHQPVCQSQQRYEGMHIEATDLEYWESN